MMKKKIKKISIIFVLTVILLSCFVLPCSAWEPPPDFGVANGSGYVIAQHSYALYDNKASSVAWIFFEYRIPNSAGGYDYQYQYFVDSRVVDEWIHATNQSFNTLSIEEFKSHLTVYGNSWTIDKLDNEILKCFELVSSGYTFGYDDGYEFGKSLSYNQGYNDGLNESDIAENTILTIFSAPTYILATIFDFELFGINLYSLICFFLTLTIVTFILKRVL